MHEVIVAATVALCIYCIIDAVLEIMLIISATLNYNFAVLYRDVMTQLLDKHCLVVTLCRRPRPATPWFDAKCCDACRKARTAERRFRRKRTDADKRVWADKLKAMREFYEAKRSSFWRTTISVNSGNSQKLWRTLHGVLGEAVTEDTGSKTTDEFATYFKDIVGSVRASTATTPLYDVSLKVTQTLFHWTAVTHDEVEKMIGSALNKSCQLNPVPTWLVKDVGQLLSPFIALLFNKSLASGIFPSDFKHAVVRPLLKKKGLDVSDPRNFRPVSNLFSFQSIGEDYTEKTSGLFRRQHVDACKTVSLPSVS